jgi:hypothetical protein
MLFGDELLTRIIEISFWGAFCNKSYNKKLMEKKAAQTNFKILDFKLLAFGRIISQE